MMNIPDKTMPVQLVEVKDYDNRSHKMRKTMQNTFFNKKFGRTDFELLPNNPRGKAMATRYITKYLGKSQGKIVYSRGLPILIVMMCLPKRKLNIAKNLFFIINLTVVMRVNILAKWIKILKSY